MNTLFPKGLLHEFYYSKLLTRYDKKFFETKVLFLHRGFAYYYLPDGGFPKIEYQIKNIELIDNKILINTVNKSWNRSVVNSTGDQNTNFILEIDKNQVDILKTEVKFTDLIKVTF